MRTILFALLALCLVAACDDGSFSNLSGTPADGDLETDRLDNGEVNDDDWSRADLDRPDGDDSDGDRMDAEPENDADSEETGEIDSPETDSADDNPIASYCPQGVADCPAGQGCVGGACGVCQAPEHCRALESCRTDGVCGACEDSSQCREGTSCADGFCLQAEIGEFRIAMDPADFEALKTNIYGETWYPCVVTANGRTYNLGEQIRLLGNFSRSFPTKSFRITSPSGVDHPGFSRKMNLKAEWDDPTHMRSFLAYHLYRQFTTVPAPRVRYWKVLVNDAYYGLMVETERVGDNFLEANGRDAQRSMYEAAYVYPGGTFVPIAAPETYDMYYAKKNGLPEDDYSDLVHFIENVIWPDFEDSDALDPGRDETTTARVREALHVEHYLKYLAVNTLIQNADTITNNFYFSWQADPTGRLAWEFYPWDMDLTFGCLYDEDWTQVCHDFAADRWWQNGIVDDEEEVGPDHENWINLLIHLVILDPEFAPRYSGLICEYLDRGYWQNELPRLLDALGDRLWPAIEPDPGDQIETRQDFEAAKDYFKRFLVEREEYLREAAECRAD
ncbi:MAG: hypothetical protein C4523_05965 [Myxococcales bacterium]|nr:MAG: hypothetical protein C4523_05965 [Myxococcales bacterium]